MKANLPPEERKAVRQRRLLTIALFISLLLIPVYWMLDVTSMSLFWIARPS